MWNFLKWVIDFKFCVWLFYCLERPSSPLPVTDSYLTVMFEHRRHLFQKASLNSARIRLIGLHMTYLCWDRLFVMGPGHPWNFCGYARNVSPWPLFTPAISHMFAASNQEGWDKLSSPKQSSNSLDSKSSNLLIAMCFSCSAGIHDSPFTWFPLDLGGILVS